METCRLIKLWKNGDKAALDKVVEINMGLVYSIVKRFCGRGIDYDDLVQIGALGLIKAIYNFDLNYNVKFSTYAVPVITGEIKRNFRDGGIIKVSRSVKENYYKVSRTREYFYNVYGVEATIDDIIKLTNLSREDVIMAIDSSKMTRSIDEEILDATDSKVSLADSLADTRDDYKEVNRNLFIQSLLCKLSDFQKQIINMRFFQDMTQTEVAKRLGISQVQVSRQEKRILLFLRSLV